MVSPTVTSRTLTWPLLLVLVLALPARAVCFHLPTSGQSETTSNTLIMTSHHPKTTTTDYNLLAEILAPPTTTASNLIDSKQQPTTTTPAPLLDNPPNETELKAWTSWVESISRNIFSDFYQLDVFSSISHHYGTMDSGQGSSPAAQLPPQRTYIHIPDITGPRPFLGDYFVWFQDLYWPTHCILCLIICTIGIFANVTNIIVLTRPHMITAVNTILTALAFFDLLVNMSTIPFVYHELSDQTNAKLFYHYLWGLYILFHAHLTVTVHTVSLWLTCALATWRYYVVCRSKSSSQRILTIGLAKRIIVAIVLLVPVSCIPNYLSFDLVTDSTTVPNVTIYKVGYSDLSSESWAIRTIHFSIYSVVDKLVPCVLLLFFTTALIRTLLKARKRRLRLNNHTAGDSQLKDTDKARLATGNQGPTAGGSGSARGSDEGKVIANGGRNHLDSGPGCGRRQGDKIPGNRQPVPPQPQAPPMPPPSKQTTTDNCTTLLATQQRNIVVQQTDQRSSKNTTQLHINESTRTTEPENMAATSSGSSVGSGYDKSGPTTISSSNIQQHQKHQQHQHQPKALSNLIVESINSATNNTTVSTTTFPLTKALEVGSDSISAGVGELLLKERDSSSRSASTCGALNIYWPTGNKPVNCDSNQPLVMLSKTASHNQMNNQSRNLSAGTGDCLQISDSFRAVSADAKVRINGRGSLETAFEARVRSLGSVHLAPQQMSKLQTTQRQLNQNETTTKLLIAVMLVFLVCETPAGILTAGCAIWGEPFFDNVYLPLGLVTDLLALINSSVNFALYCLMSKQFRTTFLSMVFGCCDNSYESNNRANRAAADPTGRKSQAANKDRRTLNDLC